MTTLFSGKIAILLSIFAFGPGFAMADANLNCSAYAGIAVQQQEQNLSLGCGFSGGAWSADFQDHYNWCAQDNVKMVDLTTDDNARKAALSECAARPQLAQEVCIEYSQNAILAARMSSDANCGLQGGAWSEDFAAHFSWCVGADQGARDSEAAARSNQLAGCYAAQYTARQTECSGYAQAAVIQNQDNIDRGCGFTGGRWTNDSDGHFKWCMDVNAEATEAEAELRNSALATQCAKPSGPKVRCWTEVNAVVGIPPWEIVRKCKTN